MEYLIGVLLALAVVGLAASVGFYRERSFYSTALIVIASFYVLFAVMGATRRTLITEIVIAGVFTLFAVIGYRRSFWLVAVATVGHGLFDFVHHLFIDNAGMPPWWPGFCGAFDVVFGGALAIFLTTKGSKFLSDHPGSHPNSKSAS
jgi:hypothetical protein